MSAPIAIATHEVTKRYRDVVAVDRLDLTVRRGEIYGFLGRNGAGKTTTIRMLLGLIQPSEGDIDVLGKRVQPGATELFAHVGYLVESATAYPNLTVRENLDIQRRLTGAPHTAVGDAIELMRLGPNASRRAGVLSLGNKQRLSLARALLHRPELLVLDEPANALDPGGIVEVRELLRSLAAERGVTVFMSSHILTEVDRLATRIGIIHQGRLIEELDSKKLEALRLQRLEVKTRNLEAAQSTLAKAGFTVKIAGNILVLSEARAINAPEAVATILVNAGTPPFRLAVEQEDLEEHFLHLTREKI